VCCVRWFLVACSGTPGMAADKANYSGKYSLQGRKTASGNKIDSTIEVVLSCSIPTAPTKLLSYQYIQRLLVLHLEFLFHCFTMPVV
jgi:hypothetical protein